MAESRKVLGSLIVLGIVLSTFAAAASVVATLPPKLIPHISLAPTENLVGYWNLNETSGTTASDSSGMGNHGTVYGATWVAGKVNNALSFDGTDDKILVPDSPSLSGPSALTIEMWIKGTDTTAVLASKYVGGTTEYLLQIVDDTVYFMTYGGTTANYISRYKAASSLTDGVWHHLVATWDGGTAPTSIKIYKDTVQIDDTSASVGTFTGIPDTSADVEIGGNPTITRWWAGSIDEVRIYNRALSASEINAIYQEEAAAASSLSVSPSSFTLSSGGSTTLTATLTSGGSALTGKTISWSATSGTLSPSSGTTNSSGQVTVTYTAPTVTSQTSVTVTASFAGDASYNSSSGTSSGTINPMAGYWHFDETSGTIASDSSGNGNHGTVYGATWVAGKVNNALSFDGNDFATTTLDDAIDGQDYVTVEAWIKASSAGSGSRVIVSKTSGADATSVFRLEIGPNYLQVWFGGSYVSTSVNLADDTWHHVVGVRDGTTIRPYIDGVAQATGSAGSYKTGTTPVEFGRINATYGYYFNGVMDEVRIYNRALSASEISAHYQEGAGAASTTLSISPSSFTLSSGGSTTLTATLTSGGSPLANKTISWSATSGSLSPASGTTNTSGQVTVTYTAPTVTTQTSVTITVSFAGDASYQSSSGTSSGVIWFTPIGGQQIVVNGNFSTGDATGWTFEVAPATGPLGSYEIVNYAARIYRSGAGSYGRGAGLYQAPNVNVSNASSITLSFGVRVDYQSLSGLGSSDIEAPAYVEILYRDVNGQDRYFSRRFYYTGSSSNTTAEKISQSTWVYRSYELASLSPKPATIKRVSILTSGWDYDSSFDDVSLLYTIGAVVAPTSLSISPSSFTENSGESRILTATLTSNGSPVANKTITWSVTNGSLSSASGTTNSSGQVSVTYTAPMVAAQTSVTIAASFAGDSSYQASSGTSSGTIELGVKSTMLSIFPSTFALYPGYSGQVQSLIATLRDSNYNALAGKTITWSATLGSVSPSSGATDPLGQVSVVYTAPTVTAETVAKITASFAGDAQYESSSGTSSGIPAIPISENIPASTGGTIVINVIEINVTVNVLVVPPNALPEDATITVVETPPENLPAHAMVSHIFDIGPSGTTFTTPSTITLPYNENELPEGVSEDDLAIYRRAGPGSWEKVVGNMQVDKAANTVSVEIDHLSEYAVMAQLPTQPFVVVPPMWVIAAAVLGLLSVLIAMVWFHLREARGDATSVLIEHGLPDMRITEVEVVREIRGIREFTIPDLVQRTGSSRVLVWRTVKKLAEKGLVRPTTEVRPPATGRGKPSRVYEYVGD